MQVQSRPPPQPGSEPILIRETGDPVVPPPIGLGIMLCAVVLCALYLAHRLNLADRSMQLRDLEHQSKLLPALEEIDRELQIKAGYVPPLRLDPSWRLVGTGTPASPLVIAPGSPACDHGDMRHIQRRRFELHTDTVRILTERELARAAGGARSELSERDTVGACPGQYSNTCGTGFQ